ncbi:hypothetical protein LX99_02961 [Mucilaginibacter oryzae]|uniref:Uncharacterized protein n=1 Tax=Mucilaginibacter oryzae TaxID=468058 RepID=A0A316HAS4_9SPHI|nr:hypothetical protein [Mucilaginibacter oryzae]PWK77151.1 hypothetical protein LX99_02961 [Mucilaginibacter oryzae]
MKHAFIFGTTIFLSENNTLNYSDGLTHIEFLKILSFHDESKNRVLTIDAHITSKAGNEIKISANNNINGANIRTDVSAGRIKVFEPDNDEPVLDIYQLNSHEYHGLSSHILNEIHAQHPDHVVSVKGNFTVNDAHFLIENEKMFIDQNGYANGVVNAHHGVILSAADIDLTS